MSASATYTEEELLSALVGAALPLFAILYLSPKTEETAYGAPRQAFPAVTPIVIAAFYALAGFPTAPSCRRELSGDPKTSWSKFDFES